MEAVKKLLLPLKSSDEGVSGAALKVLSLLAGELFSLSVLKCFTGIFYNIYNIYNIFYFSVVKYKRCSVLSPLAGEGESGLSWEGAWLTWCVVVPAWL